MNDYTTQDFMHGMDVRYWDGAYAEELLAVWFPVASGFAELA